MALKSEQIGQLLKMIQATRDVEITCPECQDELDRYTQRVLDGEPIEGLLKRVREHLEDCPFCTNEYELVRETLRAIGGS